MILASSFINMLVEMTKMNGSFSSTFFLSLLPCLWGQTVCCCLSLVANPKLQSNHLFICMCSSNSDLNIWSLVCRWWSSSADSSSMNYRAILSKELNRRDKQTETNFLHVHTKFILLSTLSLMFFCMHIHCYTAYILVYVAPLRLI